MLEFHDIMEGWLLDSSEEALSPWKAKLLRGHLAGCERCRAFALELVEFVHDVEAVPAPRKDRLSSEEASLLHSQVMAAFHRQRSAEAAVFSSKPAKKLQLRTYFGVRPQFAKALGLVALVLGLLMILAQNQINHLESEAAAAAPKAPSVQMLDPSPAALPVPVPSATASPIP